MKELLFFGTCALLIYLLFKRDKVRHSLLHYFGLEIQNSTIITFVALMFVVVFVLGMLFDDTKDKYSNISDNYDNMIPKEDKRPHRYFDINTYW